MTTTNKTYYKYTKSLPTTSCQPREAGIYSLTNEQR